MSGHVHIQGVAGYHQGMGIHSRWHDICYTMYALGLLQLTLALAYASSCPSCQLTVFNNDFAVG